MIVSFSEKLSNKELKINYIDSFPFFKEETLETIKDLSSYYFEPIGRIIKILLPSSFLKIKEKTFLISKDKINFLPKKIAKKIKRVKKKELSFKEIEKKFNKENIEILEKLNIIREKEEPYPLITLNIDCAQEKKNKEKISNVFFLFGENAYNYDLFIKCDEGQNLYIFPDKDTIKKLNTQNITFYIEKNIKEIYEQCYCSNNFNVGGTFKMFSFSYSNLKNILFFKEDLGNYKLFKEPYLDIKRIAYFYGKNYKADLYYISHSLSLEGFFMEKNNLARTIFTGFQDKNLTFNYFPAAQKNKSFISQKLLDFIYSKRKEEILFYIPKSGYSYMYCPKCESINTCPKCNNYLTFFKDLSLVKCTKCGFSTDELGCIKCKSYCFSTGVGIEKVKETVENILGLKISKDRYNFIFSNSNSEFLIKRENVVLLFPDNLLSIPSYKARSYYYSTIFNGYACAKKNIFIESSYVDEYVYKSLTNKNPYIFLENELSIRKEEELPPFKKFLLLLSDSKEVAFILFSILKEIGYKVFYPKLSYKNGKEKFKVLLKIDSKEDIKNILSIIKERKLRVRVYIDPPDLDF